MDNSKVLDLIKFSYERFSDPDISFRETKFLKRCSEQYACEKVLDKLLSSINCDPEDILYEEILDYEYLIAYFNQQLENASGKKLKSYTAKLKIYKDERNAVEVLYNYLQKRRKQ